MTSVYVTVDNIIGRTRFARWVTMATDTHLEYVIVLASESASMLGYNTRGADKFFARPGRK